MSTTNTALKFRKHKKTKKYAEFRSKLIFGLKFVKILPDEKTILHRHTFLNRLYLHPG